MAALTGVKVIDMVGGEVSKISYNGEEYTKVAEREDGEKYPKAGDIALRTNASSFIDKGGYYEVDSLPDGVNPRLVGHSGGYFERENFDFFRKVSEKPSATDTKLAELEERIAALEATQPPAQPAQPLKVGDYAKVIRNVDEYEAGDFIEITGGESPSGYYELTVKKVLADDHRGYIDNEYVVPATDEEVAEAKRQAKKDETDRKLEAKFAEIGRKPGEFKAGDIVRVVDPCGTFCLKVGQITEVVNPCESGAQDVRSNDGGTRYAIVELITPVERRFDRG